MSREAPPEAAVRPPRAWIVVAAGALAVAGLVAVQALVVRPALVADLTRSAMVAGEGPADTASVEPTPEPSPGSTADASRQGIADATDPGAALPPPAVPPSPEPAPPADLLAGLPPLQFLSGSDDLTPPSRETLAMLAERIASAPAGTRFEIRTHTDSQGDAAYNQWLSEQRAAAVCDGLIHAGIARERLTVVGVGESSPLVSPEVTDADRAANRRVEVVPLS